MPQPVSVAFRWSEETKAVIKDRAAKLELSVSEYVRRAALGELDIEPSDIDKRFQTVERRLKRLEELAYG